MDNNNEEQQMKTTEEIISKIREELQRRKQVVEKEHSFNYSICYVQDMVSWLDIEEVLKSILDS